MRPTGPSGSAAFLPRTAQIGVRSVTRRKRRSLATVVQIALAVGTLLARARRSRPASRRGDPPAWTGSTATSTSRSRSEGGRPLDGRRSADPHDARRRSRAAGARERGEGRRRGRVAVGASRRRRSSATESRTGAGSPTARSEAAARGRQREEHREGDRRRRRRAASRSRHAPVAPPRFASSASPRTQRRTGRALRDPLSTLRASSSAQDGVNAYWVRRDSADRGSSTVRRRGSRIALAAPATRSARRSEYVDEAANVAANRRSPRSIARARLPDRRDQHGRARQRRSR